MLSFTVWSLIEAISIWLTSYVDIFIVSATLSKYYLGLYQKYLYLKFLLLMVFLLLLRLHILLLRIHSQLI